MKNLIFVLSSAPKERKEKSCKIIRSHVVPAPALAAPAAACSSRESAMPLSFKRLARGEDEKKKERRHCHYFFSRETAVRVPKGLSCR